MLDIQIIDCYHGGSGGRLLVQLSRLIRGRRRHKAESGPRLSNRSSTLTVFLLQSTRQVRTLYPYYVLRGISNDTYETDSTTSCLITPSVISFSSWLGADLLLSITKDNNQRKAET
jgi:hypothetical protein